jgi:hypothetical protein
MECRVLVPPGREASLDGSISNRVARDHWKPAASSLIEAILGDCSILNTSFTSVDIIVVAPVPSIQAD